MAQPLFSSLLQRLKGLRQDFLQSCRDDVPGLLAARTYAENFLGHLQKAFAEQSLARGDWTVVAVGGFGRGEMSYASDLDLLFLYRNRLPQILQDIIQEFVYGLWDADFEVGHVAASLSGVKRLAQDDFTVLTNYLETRFVAGDLALYDAWRKAFLRDLGSPKRRKFLQQLAEYRAARLQQYGESSYLLEPHVKEGVGGLRDLHAIRWAGSAYRQNADFAGLLEAGWLTEEERLWLERAYDFLWRVRLQLHQLSGRRQDQLLFPEQEQVALRLGFLDGLQGSAVEGFMRLYYRHAARIRRTTTFFLERLGESQRKLPRVHLRKRILPGPFVLQSQHLHFVEPEWIKNKPHLLMQFFWQAARTGAHFHHQAGHVIRENLSAFDDHTREDAAVIGQFLDILLHPRHAFQVLDVMLETGFLEVFLPEFAAVRFRVQHDVYHLYTVDEHLLRTVRELHRMEHEGQDPLLKVDLRDIFVQVKNRRVLFLAALLHDIGKGQGKNHARRGAAIVADTALRLGLSNEEKGLLQFLVGQHLILAETALKRDLMEEKPILRCALTTGDRERLRMLYLLTIADSRATGPGAWNSWKASLLRELFVKTDRQLQRGEWMGENVQERSEKVQQSVLELVADPADRGKVARWLDQVSFRYLLSQSPAAIMNHYGMERELAGGPPVIVHMQATEGEMWQITVATRDRPGLFAIITGVLWLRHLNILSADIFTRPSGIALDILIVERLPDPLHPGELWERIRTDLQESLRSRDHLEQLLASRRKPSLLQQKNVPRREDRVLIDEEGSDFYTIIEVYTWDRPGVLHMISSTFYELGISIQVAKISTPGAQVADVFYVTDLDGSKLLDSTVHETVRGRLMEVLAANC